MSAIITDQLRILNASNFVAGVGTTTNNYYAFIGLPNPTELLSDWDTEPPAPIDSFDEENDIWDTMIALKKIEGSDTRQIVRKISWSSGTTYEMYRHDYSRNNPSPITGATNLYDSDFYVMNSDFRVYICLSNGVSPENPDGRPSLDEPTFTDLEPRAAGSSGDGYIWKYLFTISPSEIVKFESSSYILFHLTGLTITPQNLSEKTLLQADKSKWLLSLIEELVTELPHHILMSLSREMEMVPRQL